MTLQFCINLRLSSNYLNLMLHIVSATIKYHIITCTNVVVIDIQKTTVRLIFKQFIFIWKKRFDKDIEL